MTLAMPLVLMLLPAVPVLGALLFLTAWRHRAQLRAVLSEAMLARVLPRSMRRRRVARDLLVLLALGLALVAVAEPRFDQQMQTVRAEGADIVLLLDLSRSMDARDVDPSRLGRARREIADLGEILEGDRLGLVVFAGGAFPRLPLTNDFKAVELVISEADTDTFDTQGSNLGAAIDAGVELLERSQGEAGRALLVLSDGETHQPDRALESARAAAEKGVAIYAMGIGVEEVPIPMRDGTFLQHEGKVATTAPDFEILRQVAEETRGAFVTSNASTRDIEGLYQALRSTVRAVEREATRRQSFESAYQWPLAVAALAWLASAWLGDGRRTFGAAAAVLLAASLTTASPASAAPDRLVQADALYRAGKYAQAAEQLVELSLERPGDPDVLDRLGAARYRAGDFEGAARAWDQAAGAGDADALFNAGNAHYQAGRLEEAVRRYEDVLRQTPEHPAAAHNKELVAKEIEARRAQKPPPPPKPEDGPRQDGQQGEEQQPPPQGGQGEEQQPQGGQGEQQPQPGQPGQPGEDGEPKPEEGQQGGPEEQQPGSEPVDPSQVAQDGSGDPQESEAPTAGGGGAEGEEKGPVTTAQAERLLDSVEEGAPRTVVQGRPEGKPW